MHATMPCLVEYEGWCREENDVRDDDEPQVQVPSRLGLRLRTRNAVAAIFVVVRGTLGAEQSTVCCTYIFMACIVMADMVMAYMAQDSHRRYSYGRYSYGLHGRYSCGLHGAEQPTVCRTAL